MTKRHAAATYARISQDRDGAGLGVQRQLNDCRAEARRRGWIVAGDYVDDDVSAYSGSRRPAYERLLDGIACGAVDAVLVWHMDRLHRRPIELEQFVTTCLAAGLHDVVRLHGDFDIGNGDGLVVARLMSTVAANESDARSRRSKRKMEEMAEEGRPHGGGTRPFGFNDDRITHRRDEARVIRALADRALAGKSLTSLCRWLTDEGVTTVIGNKWRIPTVRGLLLNPRIYGMRAHRGQALAPAVWKPIISAEKAESLRALLTDPGRRTNRTARSYLLVIYWLSAHEHIDETDAWEERSWTTVVVDAVAAVLRGEYEVEEITRLGRWYKTRIIDVSDPGSPEWLRSSGPLWFWLLRPFPATVTHQRLDFTSA